MLDNLSKSFQDVLGKFRRTGKLTEADIEEGTREVRRALLEADTSRKRRSEVIDHVAAGFILQGLLDRLQVLRRAS